MNGSSSDKHQDIVVANHESVVEDMAVVLNHHAEVLQTRPLDHIHAGSGLLLHDYLECDPGFIMS